LITLNPMSALPDYYACNGYLSRRFDLTWERGGFLSEIVKKQPYKKSIKRQYMGQPVA
jgi:hypothetical protein